MCLSLPSVPELPGTTHRLWEVLSPLEEGKAEGQNVMLSVGWCKGNWGWQLKAWIQVLTLPSPSLITQANEEI